MKTIVVALLLIGSVAHAHEDVMLMSCPRNGGEYLGTIRGHVRLHNELLAAMGDRQKAIDASIQQQLRYMWGWYRNDETSHAALQVTMSAIAPKITIVSERAVPYGRDLSLTYRETQARLALDDAYTLAGTKRGSVSRNDPSTLVEYEVEMRLAICGRNGDVPATLRTPLPDDPWLAYFEVPIAHHRPLRYHYERMETNPCADDDFADLPHPFYYWYDWLPTRHGPDDDGKPFDCRELLHAGDQYDLFDVALTRIGAPTGDLSTLRDQLRDEVLTMTLLYGVVDHKLMALDVAALVKALGTGNGRALFQRSVAERRRQTDAGTRALLVDLSLLAEKLSDSSFASRADGKALVVDVRGRLPKSHRPVALHFALSLTDVFGPTPPDHWRILRRALKEDRVVVYYGHSGIGENFRLAQIEKHEDVTHDVFADELQRSPTRLIAFLSCYSYMYFGEDLLAASGARSADTSFVFTATEQGRHIAGPLMIVSLVDRLLATQGGKMNKVPDLPSEEMWLLKSVRR